MKIPPIVYQKVIDSNGLFSPQFQLYFDTLNKQMNENISDDGFCMPERTTADINHIANNATANSKRNGTIWYDTDTNQFKGKINGVVKVFQMI